MEYFETSAKTNINIEALKEHIIEAIYNRLFGGPKILPGDSNVGEAGPSNKNNGSVVISRTS